MKASIIADSCCDLNDYLKERFDIEIVPLSISVNDRTFIDDEDLDREELLEEMRRSDEPPKTASPAPNFFMEKFREAENAFVVTLSSKLSGTFQNATLARQMFEELEEKFIHVFDSLSASAGETMVSFKIGELLEEGLDRETIVDRVNNYIEDMKTMFVLESLDNLIKAGRIGRFKGKLASILNIKPVMGSDSQGNIKLIEKARGTRRALKRLVELIGEKGEDLEEKVLGIAHCNALDKAEKIRDEVQKKYNFREVVIVETAGISTVYANEGGIVIAF